MRKLYSGPISADQKMSSEIENAVSTDQKVVSEIENMVSTDQKVVSEIENVVSTDQKVSSDFASNITDKMPHKVEQPRQFHPNQNFSATA